MDARKLASFDSQLGTIFTDISAITLYSGLFSEHTVLLKDLLGDVSSVVLTLLLITRLSKTESGIFISWLISLLPKDLFRFYSFQLRNRSAVN